MQANSRAVWRASAGLAAGTAMLWAAWAMPQRPAAAQLQAASASAPASSASAPANPVIHPDVLRALAAIDAGDYKHARDILDATQFARQREAPWHLAYGLLYACQNDYPQAVTSMETAVAIAPQFAEAQLQLAIAGILRGLGGQAPRHLLQAAELAPQDARPMYVLAMYQTTGQVFDQARSTAAQAAQRKGDWGAAAATLLEALNKLEDQRQGARSAAAKELQDAGARSTEAQNELTKLQIERQNLLTAAQTEEYNANLYYRQVCDRADAQYDADMRHLKTTDKDYNTRKAAAQQRRDEAKAQAAQVLSGAKVGIVAKYKGQFTILDESIRGAQSRVSDAAQGVQKAYLKVTAAGKFPLSTPLPADLDFKLELRKVLLSAPRALGAGAGDLRPADSAPAGTSRP